MITIQVDKDVFAALKSQAEPFVDQPNDVLRRLLGLNPGRRQQDSSASRRHTSRRTPSTQTDGFMDAVLESLYGGGFTRRAPYRTMFESHDQLVYFQNYNSAGTSNLWYRLRGSALDLLTSARKKSVVIFTNPAEGSAYVLPAAEIRKRANRVGWARDDLEVNIDPAAHRWRELDWDLTTYFSRLSAGQ